MQFKAEDFRTQTIEPCPCFLGNGHTQEKNLWKVKYSKTFNCWMIGQSSNSHGCISIKVIDGVLDAAFYFTKPSETFCEGGFKDAIYKEYSPYGGVGLEIINEMKLMLIDEGNQLT